jgi:hypothetical protein
VGVTGQSRTLVVITSFPALLTFRIPNAAAWGHAAKIQNGSIVPQQGIKVFREDPAPGVKPIAEFPDVLAVYWEDEVTLVMTEDDEEE